ncbi:MAG: mechanosensitive ion channel [Ignavibacteriae bacterium]|nr:mechanosensitive ion channel [Ignavibacteriota bacterium]MCB9214328.1 mechanosensitive ion channel [Ignavibacteria bacterium]
MEQFLNTYLYNPTVGKLVAVIAGILLVVVLVRFVQKVLGRRVASTEVRYRARKFVSFAGYFVSILVITVVFSDKLGGVTVALGVAGAGIAFALQEVIASVAGWLAISFAHFYNTGDRVQLGGIKGDVIDIGILRTTLMEVGQWVDGDLYNGRVVRIANSFVFKEPVFNYSGEFPFLWDEIKVPVRYGGDVSLAKQILSDVAEEVVGAYTDQVQAAWDHLVRSYLIENAQIQPMVTLVATDNWMEFTLRYVVNFKERRRVKDLLFARILEEFAKSGDSVEFASTTFELTMTPDFNVRLVDYLKGKKEGADKKE